jgi:hypothetical protein
LGHRQCHHRRGFGAQHARAEAGGVETASLGLFDFDVGQAALRADQERQACRFGVAHQRLGHRMQHQFQFGRGLLQPVSQQQWRMNHRHP